MPQGVKPACAESGSYGDIAELIYKTGRIRMHVKYQASAGLVGPMMVPFIPGAFFGGRDYRVLILDVEMDGLGGVVKRGQITVRADEEPKWLVPRVPVLPDGFEDQARAAERPMGSYDTLAFDMPEGDWPHKLTVALEGMKIDGQLQERREVTLFQRGPLHYIPVAMMHADYPYTSLPCADNRRPE